MVQENSQTVWTAGASKLFRNAPEHVRPVTASEAREIPISHNEPSVSIIAQQIPWGVQKGMTRAIDLNTEIPNQIITTPTNPHSNDPNPSSV